MHYFAINNIYFQINLSGRSVSERFVVQTKKNSIHSVISFDSRNLYLAAEALLGSSVTNYCKHCLMLGWW